MGLFDFFRKNKTIQEAPKQAPQAQPVQQEAPLTSFEEIMKKASQSPAFRAEFYNHILSTNLTVITSGRGTEHEGSSVLKEDTEVDIFTYEDGKIPVFTSPGRIMDKGIVKEQVRFMEMAAANLFELTKGATLLLNPFSDFGKEMLPGEITDILNGTILDASKKMVVEEDTQVLIGQPVVYPHEMISELCRLYADRPVVNAAYLAWIHNPASGEPPHYIFGLSISGERESIFKETGHTAQQFLAREDFVDIIEITGNSGLDGYFLNEEPFYKK